MIAKGQAVAAIIRNQDRFLLGRRSLSKPTAAGYWSPISGRMEPGETEEVAIVRECMEEVGVRVAVQRKVTEFDINGGKTRLHWWLVRVISGEPILSNDENTELKWVTVAEMESLNPIFKEDIEVFRSVMVSASAILDPIFF
jgi:8-oxo-dGTP diphosphatase